MQSMLRGNIRPRKHMHRLIVTSGTYRQSSRVTPVHLEKDPDNRLMARASRFRLPSMLLRDLALSAGGLLDGRLEGKPVYPYQPEGIWDTLAITKERDFTYPQSSGADLHRRSLYTFWRRTVAPANMFDAASRQICSVKPGLTNTPLHALTTLNDPTWVEAARGLATRAIRHSPDADARLTFAMRLVTARTPPASQIALLRRMLENQRTHFTANPDAAKAFLANGATPPAADIDPVELAIWSATALGILNLDPALTRE